MTGEILKGCGLLPGYTGVLLELKCIYRCVYIYIYRVAEAMDRIIDLFCAYK